MLGIIGKILIINLIFYFIIICISPIYCQVNFPDSNAIWNVNTVDSEGIPTGEILYGLKGDTLINDTLYHKLYILEDTTLEDLYSNDYLGGFRQDSQKVWFRPKYINITEFLLYDFSGQIDDTIWHNAGLTLKYNLDHDFEGGESYSVIQDIFEDSGEKIFILYSPRPPLEQDEWINGIGSKYGLFGSIIAFPLSGNTYNLACFKQNDTVKYENNLKCDKCFCKGSTATDEKENNTDGIVVFPNPADNSLSIRIDNPYNNISVELIDKKGSIIYYKESLENPIKVNYKLKDIYFLKLTIDNKKIIKKVIIE